MYSADSSVQSKHDSNYIIVFHCMLQVIIMNYSYCPLALTISGKKLVRQQQTIRFQMAHHKEIGIMFDRTASFYPPNSSLHMNTPLCNKTCLHFLGCQLSTLAYKWGDVKGCPFVRQ